MSSAIISIGNSIVSSATFLETKTGSTSGTGSSSLSISLGAESPTRKIMIAYLGEYYPSGTVNVVASLTVGGVVYPLTEYSLDARPNGTILTTQYSAYLGNIRMYVSDFIPTGTTGTFNISFGVTTNYTMASYNVNNFNGIVYRANTLTNVSNTTITKKPNNVYFFFVGYNGSSLTNGTVRISRTASGYTYGFGDDLTQTLSYANTVYSTNGGVFIRDRALA